jgi:CRP/FNR family transcriptional regulator, cyclic AMP receptor protein
MSKQSDQWIEALARVQLFRGFTRKELRTVAALTTCIDVPAGHTFCHEARHGRELLVVMDGSASVTVNGEEIRTIGPGEFFGEIALLDFGVRVATVTASTDMRVLSMTRGEFVALVSQVPTLACRVMEIMAMRFRSLTQAPSARNVLRNMAAPDVNA